MIGPEAAPDLDLGIRRYLALDEDVIANPYPLFAGIRSRDRVYWSEDLHGWFITGYDACMTILRSPQVSSRRHSPGRSALSAEEQERLRPLLDHLSLMMGTSDPPNHTRLRSLANKAFTPRAAEAMRTRIQQVVDDLISEAAARGSMDIVGDFSYPLPITVISDLMGVPPSDQPLVKGWSDDFIRFVAAPRPSREVADRAQASLEAMGGYFEPLVEQRRQDGGDDLLAALALASEDEDRLTRAELLAMCNSLFAGGHETTTNLIANGMLGLMAAPAERQRLAAGDRSFASATEELLRFDTSVQRLERFAAEDFELGGHKVKKDDRIWLLVGAANRDPDQFPEPDRMDMGRSPNRHLTFAHGPHYCIGAPLAKLEIQIALEALVGLGEMELETDRIEWQPMLAHRGPRAVPVRFQARRHGRSARKAPSQVAGTGRQASG